MQKILAVEWLKIRFYKAFWILLGLFVVSIVGLNYLVDSFIVKAKAQTGKANGDAILGHPFNYPDVWHTVSFWSGFLLFLPGLIIITLMTNEFTYRTHRQNIIDGWTRLQFIAIKLVWVFILALISTIVVFATAILFGALGDSPFSFLKLEYVGYFFIEALSYIAVALLFGIVLKRAGLAIGLFFLYILIIKNTISGLLNYFTPVKIGHYLPLSINDALIPFPFIKDMVKAMTQQPPNVSILLGGSVVYICLYSWIMIRTFQKADL